MFELQRTLGHGPCYPLSSDMRVRVGETRYVYPDVVVVCGDPQLEDDDTLLNPTLIIEVLSTSTEAYDRGAPCRRAHYRELPALREYNILVSQSERRIEQFVRQADGLWLLSEAVAGEIGLSSICVSLDVAAVYHGIDA